MRATWNGAVIAESDDTVVVEGNHYFPRASVREEYVRPSDTRTTCPWKGETSYLTLQVDGQSNPDVAWYYPEPSAAASQIKDRVAFWRGVDVIQWRCRRSTRRRLRCTRALRGELRGATSRQSARGTVASVTLQGGWQEIGQG
jgi:uncharacterized protein (DUF427 family)